jgi:hypothetical protein
MKATEIIRNILDLIDNIDMKSEQESGSENVEEIITGVDSNRFKHIFAMLDAERNNPGIYDNSPSVVVLDVDAVTKDAGGGWNGPKNPSDMRANSVSMYPNFQATFKE